MTAGAIALIVVALFVLFVAFAGIKIVPQARAGIVERLGRYSRTLDAGLTLIVPFIDRVKPLIDLREQVVAFPPQPVITEDNLVVGIDTVIYFTVTDPKAATYEIANPLQAIEQLTVTTLRNVIGGLTLEETLTSRDNINSQLRVVLDEATGRWGIRVNRVELKSVEPPRTVQEAMEKQMRAERDRRAAILTAEGTKQSQILTAEGEKQAAVLKAEGARTAAILRAEGESKAIDTVFQAIHDGEPDQMLLSYQYLQMLPSLAQGSANKVFVIPSDFSQALGHISGALAPPRRLPDGDRAPAAQAAAGQRGRRRRGGGRRRRTRGGGSRAAAARGATQAAQRATRPAAPGRPPADRAARAGSTRPRPRPDRHARPRGGSAQEQRERPGAGDASRRRTRRPRLLDATSGPSHLRRGAARAHRPVHRPPASAPHPATVRRSAGDEERVGDRALATQRTAGHREGTGDVALDGEACSSISQLEVDARPRWPDRTGARAPAAAVAISVDARLGVRAGRSRREQRAGHLRPGVRRRPAAARRPSVPSIVSVRVRLPRREAPGHAVRRPPARRADRRRHQGRDARDPPRAARGRRQLQGRQAVHGERPRAREGVEVTRQLNPGQQVVKIVNEELTALMGGASAGLTFSPRPPTVILMAGLQGSGKTTATAKLARCLREERAAVGRRRRLRRLPPRRRRAARQGRRPGRRDRLRAGHRPRPGRHRRAGRSTRPSATARTS